MENVAIIIIAFDLYIYLTKNQLILTPNLKFMPVKTKISETQLFELKDHRDNTMETHIKVYTASQLSFMDNVAEDTVKRKANKYLPVRVDSGPAMDRYRRGLQKKPYRTMYIRLDEIRALYKRRTGNTLEIEIN